MNTVFLDFDSLGPGDLDLSGLNQLLPDLTTFPSTNDKQLHERICEAEVVMVNKVPLDDAALAAANRLRLICLAATGTALPGTAAEALVLLGWQAVDAGGDVALLTLGAGAPVTVAPGAGAETMDRIIAGLVRAHDAAAALALAGRLDDPPMTRDLVPLDDEPPEPDEPEESLEPDELSGLGVSASSPVMFSPGRWPAPLSSPSSSRSRVRRSPPCTALLPCFLM